ncbi:MULTISPECIES: amidohydrolase family protein [Microbacterium]|uniref:amidohydrolase family protein n=1 Tax=Microbacterium TaxID=33882 RepID=UPI0023DC98BB|nr:MULTISPECIES: amidohydrolase family protein [Microbacterium]MDF2047644.1 amidohydrolase family protein [Microbacterium sp. Kw_RZR3]MDQ1074152.1 putative TIM-barrel fold metal-dependent hydrolase [Microbacterium sp. SORGH_AS_0969]MDQ1114378.1 putative TIM-barrel fold metal-dependent hydrolase [Microbacterium testaceum]
MTPSRTTAHIIDTHHHVGELALGMGEEGTTVDGASIRPVEVHAAMLDQFGLTAACVLPGFQYDRSEGIASTRALNDGIVAYRNSLPSRFPLALGTVEPLHRDSLCRDEVARLVDECRIDGLAWHTRYQGVALSDRRMHVLIDLATEHGLPCYLHLFSESGLEAPWSLLDLATAHPDATLVALDGFSGATQIRYLFDIAERCPNVLFDTAICFPLLRPLDEFVGRFGSERLLFGTDSYAQPLLYNTPSVMHELLASDMPQEDLENIMWRNLLRVFPQAATRLTLTDPSS